MSPSQSMIRGGPASQRDLHIGEIGDALGEHGGADQFDHIARRELRRRHAGEGGELVDHPADMADLADDGVGAAVEGLWIGGTRRTGICA